MSGNLSQNSITASTIVLMLAIPPLYVAPQQIQGFAPDAAIDLENADVAESQMGVDGFFAAGFVPVVFAQTITLSAASPSCAIFDNWYASQKVGKTIYQATGTLYQPAVGQKIIYQQGVLSKYAPAASAKKVLEARVFEITWGSVNPAVL